MSEVVEEVKALDVKGDARRWYDALRVELEGAKRSGDKEHAKLVEAELAHYAKAAGVKASGD